MMHPLKAIETLYLEGNKIKVLPDNWFSQKNEVPYLYLSANPWACSCSLGYLRMYLEEYDYNVYVKDGPIISADAESVICDSPRSLKGQSVIKLEESDFCNPLTPTEQSHFFDTTTPPKPTTTTTATAATTAAVPTTPVWTHGYYKIVTIYESYTVDWSDIWGSLRGDGRRVKRTTVPLTTELPTTTSTALPTTTPQTSPILTTSTALPTTMPQTSPILTTSTALPTTMPQTSPILTTSTALLTIMPQTSPISTTFSTTIPPEIQQTTFVTPETFTMSPPGVYEGRIISNNISSDSASPLEARTVFCFWLFVSCAFLCVVSAFSSLVTAFRLYFWYRGVYKSLKCIIAGKEQVKMLSYCRDIDKKQAKYQTMLFVSKDVNQVECFVNLGPKTWTEEAQNVEKIMYKEAVYHEISKEEEIEAKHVLAECTVSREANSGMSKKRYSVILREEGEKEGGETEKCDWVVGGWEVEKGASPGSSWGEWLVQNLPSMPWRVSAPPKREAESL
ncbi:platelet glycoprotein Ib alpha chain-like [Boleophthalmus pectinirostris]|uniref:platelet glycoprotein Ib alpha chain-like n=1 Tax=Boleophthalmus pectinirostris TaxID=150288 RepID=UPI0024302945|nr:platelet glycoprotein Ib alpha chain-like [Boleophthalmus pectinirostris]XP_055012144.1 platelet glycoprotein Ib alpha chain-like [Boleophthalmus pectinirostris]